jgi:TatD DNase family protein
MIEQHLPPQRAKVVMHWFSGSMAEAKRAVDLGCYFSINEQMCKTPNGAKLVRAVPLERILTETDGPFTKVDGRPSRPSDAKLALKVIASALACDEDVLTGQIAINLKRMLDPQPETTHAP